MSEMLVTASGGRRWALPFAGVMALLWMWAWWTLVSQPEDLLVTGVLAGGEVEHDVRTIRFKKAGEWLRENAEPGAVIGALSSGLVGWYASDQHVVNFDGLINNRRYLDEFLKKDRFAEYFADRGIRWFSDYRPPAEWTNGVSWCGTVPASRMVPRRHWRLPELEQAYVVWQILPDGAAFELLGADGPETRDRYAELGVAADVHGSYRVVPARDLAGQLKTRPELLVARSIPAGLDSLLHVLATPAQLDEIALTSGVPVLLDATTAQIVF